MNVWMDVYTYLHIMNQMNHWFNESMFNELTIKQRSSESEWTTGSYLALIKEEQRLITLCDIFTKDALATWYQLPYVFSLSSY